MSNCFSRILPSGPRVSQLKASGTNSDRHSGGKQLEHVLVENIFHSMLTLERRRAERSRNPFVLMLLDANSENSAAQEILRQAIDIVVSSKRETDLAGWYKQGAILGIIFTEVKQEGEIPITATLRLKIETAFAKHLGRARAAKIAISVHMIPEGMDKSNTGSVKESNFYHVLNKKVS
jgi:hypothetical protein